MDSRFGFYIEKYINKKKNLFFYTTLKDNIT